MDPHVSRAGWMLFAVFLIVPPLLAGIAGILCLVSFAVQTRRVARVCVKAALLLLALAHALLLGMRSWWDVMFLQLDLAHMALVPASTIVAMAAYVRLRTARDAEPGDAEAPTGEPPRPWSSPQAEITPRHPPSRTERLGIIVIPLVTIVLVAALVAVLLTRR